MIFKGKYYKNQRWEAERQRTQQVEIERLAEKRRSQRLTERLQQLGISLADLSPDEPLG